MGTISLLFILFEETICKVMFRKKYNMTHLPDGLVLHSTLDDEYQPTSKDVTEQSKVELQPTFIFKTSEPAVMLVSISYV